MLTIVLLLFFSRIATFKDNLGFMALTLDTSRKLHAVVWTQKGLPYDSFALTPVPKPLGTLLQHMYWEGFNILYTPTQLDITVGTHYKAISHPS